MPEGVKRKSPHHLHSGGMESGIGKTKMGVKRSLYTHPDWGPRSFGDPRYVLF
jgi:hypothetical protein